MWKGTDDEFNRRPLLSAVQHNAPTHTHTLVWHTPAGKKAVTDELPTESRQKGVGKQNTAF